ncbi:ZIP family metal transporter [Sphingomonas sp. LHG3406-1]|uniref:ZIP family metal transporter n=1 Tax=Sphingomonas sp. LHG3406-1 TaxID=2804617 RepID=UPI0026073781|nr:ZIP family metal transporter [Sphingomonas sp. LHG3406-1]
MAADLVLAGTLASFLAGQATTLGALPVFFLKGISQRTQNAFLGFAAGIMLAASFFSLIIPGLEAAGDLHGGDKTIAAFIVSGAVLLGAATLHLLNRVAPHEHFISGPMSGAERSKLSRIWLFVIAISLHNFPEGLAVGVSFGSPDQTAGYATAFGIGLQNVPEGLAVALSLAAVGYGRLFSFSIALLTGLVEPIGGFLGVGAISLSSELLPWGLGFAGGAMIWVVSSEIIPETHRDRQEGIATFALMIGLAVMMSLDWIFG